MALQARAAARLLLALLLLLGCLRAGGLGRSLAARSGGRLRLAALARAAGRPRAGSTASAAVTAGRPGAAAAAAAAGGGRPPVTDAAATGGGSAFAVGTTTNDDGVTTTSVSTAGPQATRRPSPAPKRSPSPPPAGSPLPAAAATRSPSPAPTRSPSPPASGGSPQPPPPPSTGVADTPPPAPAAASGSAGGADDGPACFPADARAQLRDGGERALAALRVGDAVAVGDGTHSEVFVFTHQERATAHRFTRLTTRTGAALTASAGHYIYLNGRLAPAAAARIGDVLTRADGTPAPIVRVQTVHARGLYNPHTLHGDIVVDGFRVSTYTSALSPPAASALLAPLRALHRLGLPLQPLSRCLAAHAPALARYVQKAARAYQ